MGKVGRNLGAAILDVHELLSGSDLKDNSSY